MGETEKDMEFIISGPFVISFNSFMGLESLGSITHAIRLLWRLSFQHASFGGHI